MSYRITTLDSGLRVATESLPGAESVAVTVSVGVGARHESEPENGISHLLEHMAFKGTDKRSARDIAEAFDMIGGQSNAYTSTDTTVYFARVLKRDVRLAVDILADILQNSVFDDTELEREKDVVIQEIGMHYDSPDDLIMDYFDEVAYPNQPLGRSILSSAKRIASYSRNNLLSYMRKHYAVPRMVLSAAGAVDHEQFVALAEEFFTQKGAPDTPEYEPGVYAGGDRRVKRQLEQMHLVFGVPGVSAHHPDYYALQLYASVLGGGMSSRLFQEVREKRGLAYTVYASSQSYDDCGMMSIYAATAPAKARELSGVLCEEIAATTHNISETELARARNQHKADLLMARENPQSIAAWIGRHLLTYGEYRNAENVISRLDAVTVADIERVAQTLLAGKPSLAALGEVGSLLPYEELERKLSSRGASQ